MAKMINVSGGLLVFPDGTEVANGALTPDLGPFEKNAAVVEWRKDGWLRGPNEVSTQEPTIEELEAAAADAVKAFEAKKAALSAAADEEAKAKAAAEAKTKADEEAAKAGKK